MRIMIHSASTSTTASASATRVRTPRARAAAAHRGVAAPRARATPRAWTTTPARRGDASRTFGSLRPAITQGERLPADVVLRYFDDEGALQTRTLGELTRERTCVLFAVPGAFTPTCSTKHLPGYIKYADEMRANGADAVMCVSVNDAFVMNAWGESAGARRANVMMLADGSATMAKSIGVDLDLIEQGLGVRSRRYAMVVRDGVVEHLAMEQGGEYKTSGAEECLEKIKTMNLVRSA